MKLNKMGGVVIAAVFSTLSGIALGQDDFDKLLKEIGGTPAVGAAQPAAPAQPDGTKPEAVTKSAETSTGMSDAAADDKSKAREAKADIKAALAPPDQKTVSDAQLMAQQEEVRKQALEAQARKNLEKGTKALRSGDFDTAIKMLEETVRNMPARPATEAILEGAKATLGQAYLAKANAIVELAKKKPAGDAIKDMQTAREFAAKAREQMPANAEIDALTNRIQANESRFILIMGTPVKIKDRPEFAATKKTIAQLLDEGRQYFNAKDYNNAEAAYDEVLKKDEYNTEAMRYLRKIGDIRYDIHTTQRDATTSGMMDDVRKNWTPPLRQEVQLPKNENAVTNIATSTLMQKKMDSMVIPEINFRQANIADVVSFLVDASREADIPDHVGVNIILKLNLPNAAGGQESAPVDNNRAAPDLLAPTPPAADAGAAPVAAPSTAGGFSVPNITLALRRTSLLNAVKYICEVAGLHYRLEDNAIIITPAGVVEGTVLTRLYPVQSSIFENTVKTAVQTTAGAGGGRGGAGGGGGGGGGAFIGMGAEETIQREDVKAFFENAGVPFPTGTSISYKPALSKLIVANTPDNLEKLEHILAELSITPSQVEIEARFVELNQNDLQELGLEWILANNYTIATQNNGIAPVGSTPSIVAQADPAGLTKGLNFLQFNSNSGLVAPSTSATGGTGVSPLGNILTIAGVLTNPDLKAVLHAIDQHGSADVLSSPHVTTRSGVNAQIQVVREIIYPTQFESTQPQFSTGGLGGTQVVTPPLVTPGSFETREVGVILNATPTVGPDGYSIDLVLAPEVSELEGWINYGSTFGTFTFNIPQPIFNIRKVTTTIVIWDGQTVVMGGLIREQLTKTKDKIPLLGDLPLIGALFRVNSEISQKKNLMIFVTARLVDPSGKPIHAANSMGETSAGVTGTAAAH